MINSVLDIPMEFIEFSLQVCIETVQGKRQHFPDYTDLRRAYFAGRTLCLDTRDKLGNEDVITLSFEEETFGLFSGGFRRLMSIKAVRQLEELNRLCNINHEPKGW